MFERVYYATHPDMMECVSNEELRERYLIGGLFREGECVLNYTHADRFVIGGVSVGGESVRLPEQSEPPSAAGHPFLERRELAIVNVGGVEGQVTVDGEVYSLSNKDCLYVAMGAKDVIFSGEGARFYLASCPAHKAFATRKLEIAQANRLERGSLEESNERTIYQLVIPGVCDSAQLVMGLTVLNPGSVWNTMPPHIHERRSEI
ncbi:MAG: 5-dehydro-4-deoxy-D-glucuronate isomerase, partial [Myxococcales bacterium]|nr:5-dehydro-4-deoxy-D-glucuronate isomerase [Myxococcales bacterium]